MKPETKNHLRLTLKSDLNVGWPIPMDDGAGWSRLVGSSGGLLMRMATGGGARKPGGAEGGKAVTGPSGGNGWCAESAGRAKAAVGAVSALPPV